MDLSGSKSAPSVVYNISDACTELQTYPDTVHEGEVKDDPSSLRSGSLNCQGESRFDSMQSTPASCRRDLVDYYKVSNS